MLTQEKRSSSEPSSDDVALIEFVLPRIWRRIVPAPLLGPHGPHQLPRDEKIFSVSYFENFGPENNLRYRGGWFAGSLSPYSPCSARSSTSCPSWTAWLSCCCHFVLPSLSLFAFLLIASIVFVCLYFCCCFAASLFVFVRLICLDSCCCCPVCVQFQCHLCPVYL